MGKCCSEEKGHWILDTQEIFVISKLGNSDTGLLVIPRRDEKYPLPNSFICGDHLSRLPMEEREKTPYYICGIVYAISDINQNDMPFAYISHQAMRRYLPETLAMIEDFERRNGFPYRTCR